MSLEWKKIKGEKRKKLRCEKCNNPLLLVIWEPVARKVKTKTAHRMRVITKCPICKRTKRVNLGTPT